MTAIAVTACSRDTVEYLLVGETSGPYNPQMVRLFLTPVPDDLFGHWDELAAMALGLPEWKLQEPDVAKALRWYVNFGNKRAALAVDDPERVERAVVESEFLESLHRTQRHLLDWMEANNEYVARNDRKLLGFQDFYV